MFASDLASQPSLVKTDHLASLVARFIFLSFKHSIFFEWNLNSVPCDLVNMTSKQFLTQCKFVHENIRENNRTQNVVSSTINRNCLIIVHRYSVLAILLNIRIFQQTCSTYEHNIPMVCQSHECNQLVSKSKEEIKERERERGWERKKENYHKYCNLI